LTPQRLLIIQLARLGDLVQTWPLIRQLQQAYPLTHLSLLTDESLRDLVRLGPYIDDLHTLDLKEAARQTLRYPAKIYRVLSGCVEDLRKRDFELIYHLNFSRLSLLVSYLLKAPVRGYQPAAGGREVWREPWLASVYGLVHARAFNRVHLSDVFRHLAPAATVENTCLAPLSMAREPVIALQVTTRHPKRTWPLTSFAPLAFLLIEALEAEIWLMGTAGERASGERLTRSLPPHFRERVINLQGRTSLWDLAERLKEADLVISCDTGTLHLAAALGTPVLGIFLGPASCFETGPYGAGHWVIQAEPPCHPCTEAGSECAEPICQTMITSNLVAEVAIAVCGWEKFRGAVDPGVRIYHSAMDPFGVNYTIQAGKPLGWADLVGQAYRVAGSQVLRRPFQPFPLPAADLSETDSQLVNQLANTLRNGASAPGKPAVNKALAPLRAFQAVLERQSSWKALEPAAHLWIHTVKAALAEALEKLVP
jgi:ADP-heptose:LPS heptosyltransferase